MAIEIGGTNPVPDPPIRAGRPFTRSLLLAGAIVLALTLGLVVRAMDGDDDGFKRVGERTIHTLELDPESGVFSMILSPLGRPGSSVRVIAVEPIIAGGDIEYVSSVAGWPRDPVQQGETVVTGFHPESLTADYELGELVSASRTVVAPAGEAPAPLSLIVVLRRYTSGIAGINGIRVTYEMDGRTIREQFEQVAIVCEAQENCATPLPGLDERTLQDTVLELLDIER